MCADAGTCNVSRPRAREAAWSPLAVAAFRAIWIASVVSNVIPPRHLANAVALNGAGFNLARAIGPALGGLVVAAAGPGWVFLLNALSFLATIVVLYRWRGLASPTTAHTERLVEALFAG